MKNIDLVNNIVGKRLNLDEKTVKTINKFYWESVKKKLSTAEVSSVLVRNLLTFTASRYNIRKEILTKIAIIRNTKKSEKFKETTRELFLNTLYGDLRLLLKQRNRLAKLYLDEYNNRISKVTSQDKGEFSEDNSRDNN